MAQKDISTLRTQAQQIRDETTANANTAARVGGMNEDQNDSVLNTVETSDQTVASNVEVLQNLLANKLAADVADQINSGDFGGGVAIGSGVGGIVAAPLNGLLVEGNLGVGSITNVVNLVDIEDSQPIISMSATANGRKIIITPHLGSIDTVNASLQMNRNSNDSLIIGADSTARMGVGITPLAQMDIFQKGAASARPVLRLTQADLSKEMIKFDATIGVGNPIEAKGAKTFTTTYFVKASIEGIGEGYVQFGTIA